MSCQEKYCPSCREVVRAFYVDLWNNYDRKRSVYYQCGKCGVLHAGLKQEVVEKNREKEIDLSGINYLNPTIEIIHSSLVRTDESRYRSKCPTCNKGILLVQRNMETGEIVPLDICTLCGQRYIYTDIDELIKRG